jgi:CBS-domain-containing membrane protein
MRRTVEDVMTTQVVVVDAEASFKSIVQLLEKHRISAMPVVDDRGVVIGVVSEADLLPKQRYPHLQDSLGPADTLLHRAELHKARATTAAGLMSRPPITVQPGTSVAEAARLVAKAGVKRLPVVDAEGRPVGIVTRGDLLEVFRRADEEIRREVAELVLPDVWADPLAVDVTVRDGVVRLRGQVRHRSLVPVLARMAEEVDGTVAVQCELGWDVDDTHPTPVAPLRLGR